MRWVASTVPLPEYCALLRRTFPELREIVDRTQAIYPKVIPGAVYVEPEWRFPSGARLELGYFAADVDVMRYQSRQFQWIGWEELAQWPTSYPYVYLLSRLRRPERLNIPCFVRATCNPDGPGARWIADRFGIQPDGASTRREIITEGGRRFRLRFIAARLHDNPHLANTGYREQLLQSARGAAACAVRWPPGCATGRRRDLWRGTDDGPHREPHQQCAA
jgi:hypothetical protein